MKKIRQTEKIPVKRIDYSTLTEDEKRLLEVVKRVVGEYFSAS